MLVTPSAHLCCGILEGAAASVPVAATVVDALHVLQMVTRAGAAADMLAHL